MTIAVVAEKPSVARDIARVLGASGAADGAIEGGGYVVTWAIGHLVALAQPHQVDPAWKRWDMRTLPMLPSTWPLVVIEETKKQFDVVKKILRRPDVETVVCATDAGREGELIFRYIYDAAACSKPVRRLWISSLTPDAIRHGFRHLRDGKAYDPLADAARARSRADWLVGMNLSRAYSLVFREDFSVGRVQTPTLAMVAERELAIRAFVPEDYLEVRATFAPEGSPVKREEYQYDGVLLGIPEKPDGPERVARLPADGAEAEDIKTRVEKGQARIEKIKADTRRTPPPLLYDLTELQRHANRIWGFSAQKTLDIAQSLYERHKLISYPRTDSRHLSTDVAATLDSVVAAIEAPYRSLLAPGTGQTPLGKRFVDDTKVTDHHAIIPTTTSAANENLNADERRVYDLICRRLLCAWHDDLVEKTTTVITEVVSVQEGQTYTDRFKTTGTVVEQAGWKVLDLGGVKEGPKKRTKKTDAGEDSDDEPDNQALPRGLVAGQKQRVDEAWIDKKKTKPPKRFNEATLLTAMETAGKTLDEKELSDAMKDTGLGTPATRAAIIETLIKREYVTREGKNLTATDKGILLVESVHPHVKSVAMTGEWEARLSRMARGEGKLDAFLRAIEGYVKYVVGAIQDGEVTSMPVMPSMPAETAKSNGQLTLTPENVQSHGYEPVIAPKKSPTKTNAVAMTPASSPLSAATTSGKEAKPGKKTATTAITAKTAKAPSAASLRSAANKVLPDIAVERKPVVQGTPLADILRERFGFPAFRRYQEPVCRAVAEGKDVLIVMPTGAGKSLCYQLPGVARGGTTLVISPLIALMEDQVAKLRKQGFSAERIHSGRDRAKSRAACIDYLAGKLDFLFVAPERFRVPGFPEMLARRKPTLVAVDEAHCISHWGHDFRPDYRMIGQRIPSLRPAPVIALTATATPVVQDDIVRELGLEDGDRFIHGFRRTNISVEVVELTPAGRVEAVTKMLSSDARRPAIVYAPTRKHAEDTAKVLSRKYSAAAYHAGMETAVRDKIQTAFLGGDLDIVVATIAFGMGVDKANVRTVVHLALPGSVESYYQEIGRAGRDGLPSRAILMHSFVDRRTHEYFFERDYPDPALLSALYSLLSERPQTQDALAPRLTADREEFDKILEKLWIHGGAIVDHEDGVRRGEENFLPEYIAQRRHKQESLAKMAKYAEGHDCRMLLLVRHFGDQADDGTPCGICDVCAPDECVGRKFREPTAAETAAINKILAALSREDGQAMGRLHRDTFGETLDRRSFEHIVNGLSRAGLVHVRTDSFQKGGEWIEFQRVTLAEDSASASFARESSSRFVTLDEAPQKKKKSAKTKDASASKSKAFWVRRAMARKKKGS
jgi:DNA topoisomerase III